MNLDQVIRELRTELAHMNRAIESLEGLIRIAGSGSPARRRGVGKGASPDGTSKPDLFGATPEEYSGAD